MTIETKIAEASYEGSKRALGSLISAVERLEGRMAVIEEKLREGVKPVAPVVSPVPVGPSPVASVIPIAPDKQVNTDELLKPTQIMEPVKHWIINPETDSPVRTGPLVHGQHFDKWPVAAAL